MRIFTLLSVLLLVFLPLNSFAFDVSSVSSDSIYSPIVALYDNLIDVVKTTMKAKVKDLEKGAIDLLTAMAVAYLVFRIAKSYIKDEPFRSDVFEKIVLFVVLATFLQFKYFEEYTLEPLELLFNNLPSIFSSSSSSYSSSISNVLSQSGELVSGIWATLEYNNIFSVGKILIMAIPVVLATISVISLTLVIILNVLLATLKFYLVLTLSSLFILLSFFKFTRQYMLGAVQVVAGAILNITLLSVFLNMYGEIFTSLVNIHGNSAEQGTMGLMTVVILSSVGIFIVGTISEVAQAITGSGLTSAGSGAFTSKARDMISKIPYAGAISRFIK